MATYRQTQSRLWPVLTPPAFDLVCWSISIFASAYFRHLLTRSTFPSDQVGLAILVVFSAQLIIGSLLVYRNRWRIGTFEEVINVALSIAASGTVLLLMALFTRHSKITFSIVIVATLFTFMLSLGGRVAYRLFRRQNSAASEQEVVRMVIFGAGAAGVSFVDTIATSGTSRLIPVALLDDDPKKQKLRIRSIRVEGTSKDLERVASAFKATTLLIAIAGLSADQTRSLAARARALGLDVRLLPTLLNLYSGMSKISDIRELQLEDLLGRNEVVTDFGAIGHHLRGRRVLVTGAGGSIGSELARAIAGFQPASLVLLDRDESALHQLQLSLEGRAMLDSRNLVVCDIRDRPALDLVFAEHQPQLVFHAAALKHLSLLEMWPGEAFKSNVLGTLNVLQAAKALGVEGFVNISTDKAADPISVLGYSKRIAERLTAWVGSDAPGTYLSVRFGNVLGSRGSVLVAFRELVANGGPLTVTHPDVTRYFMSVNEAVQLTLQAAVLGQPGEVLILEMGEAVRIDDLARLLAAESKLKIEIIYTGLRPGEKLSELLIGTYEQEVTKPHPLIVAAEVPPMPESQLKAVNGDGPHEETIEMLRVLALDPRAKLA